MGKLAFLLVHKSDVLPYAKDEEIVLVLVHVVRAALGIGVDNDRSPANWNGARWSMSSAIVLRRFSGSVGSALLPWWGGFRSCRYSNTGGRFGRQPAHGRQQALSEAKRGDWVRAQCAEDPRLTSGTRVRSGVSGCAAVQAKAGPKAGARDGGQPRAPAEKAGSVPALRTQRAIGGDEVG